MFVHLRGVGLNKQTLVHMVLMKGAQGFRGSHEWGTGIQSRGRKGGTGLQSCALTPCADIWRPFRAV